MLKASGRHQLRKPALGSHMSVTIKRFPFQVQMKIKDQIAIERDNITKLSQDIQQKMTADRH